LKKNEAAGGKAKNVLKKAVRKGGKMVEVKGFQGWRPNSAAPAIERFGKGRLFSAFGGEKRTNWNDTRRV